MKFPTVLQAQDELAGLYEAPTDIYGMIGMSERGKVRTWSRLHCKEALSGKIKGYNLTLSGGKRCHSTSEAVIISGGGIGISRRLKEQIRMKNANVRV